MNPTATRRRRIIAAVLVVAAVVAMAIALRAPSSPGATGPEPRLTTPLWSARRTAAPIAHLVATQRLQSGLNARTQGTDACYSVQGPTGSVASTAADQPRIPASTQKLLTATAALDVLGPDFTFETKAVAANKPQAGSLDQLWLVGAGDPGLATPEAAARLGADPLTAGDVTTSLATLADSIAAAGVTAIPGGIVGDDSRYDTTRYLPEWPASYRADREIGPIGALTVNDGYGGPDGTGAEADPAVNAADQLGRLLTERGVAVGPPSRGNAPRNPTTIASVKSPPLHDVLNAFLASSDNLTAEMLTRELAVRAGKEGTTENGVAAIRARLDALELPTTGLIMVDGSGLARADRATCALLLATLDLANQPKYATLRNGLAIAGERGTLATRLRGTPLQGKLYAKTGSLTGVSGLAGFVDVKTPLIFSLLLNGRFNESTGTTLREQMAETIAAYPDVPPTDELIPAPGAPVRR